MKLIVLAAGKGTRFLPKTNTTPKGMILIGGKPLLKHVIDPFLPYVSDIIFVINKPLGKKIKDYFKKNYLGHKVFYKTQDEQKGTMDALLTCKDLIKENELFCVCNGDDLLKESEIKKAIEENAVGLGVSKKIMQKNYLGINIEDGYVVGFIRHKTKATHVKDMFYNGFNILDSRIFSFQPISISYGELGLPQTLFANLDAYPLRAFTFKAWETVNSPKDMVPAAKFIQNG